ncbi:MAG TPA: YitT family protein [Anaerolineaceae bacterium]|nr:YitT family protein [Anaerolineaceae bacterium]
MKREKKELNEADRLERKMRAARTWRDIGDYLLCMLGGVIYSAGVNLIVFPIGLYIGNYTGIAQIIQDILRHFFPGMADIRGLLLLAMNIPMLVVSFTIINRKFFFKTVLTIIMVTVSMQLIPVKQIIPGITDTLTLCIIGGLVAGLGSGLSLRSGGSAGGVDILGVYLSLKREGYSVGKVALIISLLVYAYTLFTFPVAIVIYSIIFTLILVYVIDQVHFQNRKIQVTIVSKDRGVLDLITKKIVRGASYWEVKGAYTDEPRYLITTVVSKYELIRLRRLVIELDPHAFLIEGTEVNVTGYFPSHFF